MNRDEIKALWAAGNTVDGIAKIIAAGDEDAVAALKEEIAPIVAELEGGKVETAEKPED